MTSNTNAQAPTDETSYQSEHADKETMVKAVVAGSVGTVIEWYDYALYGTAAGLVINVLFFPSLSQTAALLAAFATFAVGYFARPLGGIIISHIGDKFGRKPALIFAIVLMGATTTLLGLLPTYESIGIAAPIILVFLRLFQGFGAGAELAGALTFVAEYVPYRRRALCTAIINASTVVGIMFATGAFFIVSSLPEESFMGWGWRIPFLCSAVLFAIALYIRERLDETPVYAAAMARAREKAQQQKVPLFEVLKNSPKQVVFNMFALCGHSANSYILSVFIISYMVNTLGFERSDALTALMWASFFAIIGTPLMGMLADKIGHAKVYILGNLFIAAFSIPMFLMVDTMSLPMAALGMSIMYSIGYGCTSGAQGAFQVNLFPVRYRYSGIAISRELNSVLISGPTPFIAAFLVDLGGGTSHYVMAYYIVCCLVSVAAVSYIAKYANHH